jgi:hypothetical protein
MLTRDDDRTIAALYEYRRLKSVTSQTRSLA